MLKNPKIGKKPLCSSDDGDFNDDATWEEFLYNLAGYIRKRFSTGYAKVYGENMGWRRLSGYKVIKFDLEADDDDLAREFLEGFVPDCAFITRVFSLISHHGLYFRLFHHDNPVNGDEYYLVPITRRTYEQFMYA